MHIDFNCDMGESFGNFTFGADEELMRFISSANVAGGFHAGDPHVMRETVAPGSTLVETCPPPSGDFRRSIVRAEESALVVFIVGYKPRESPRHARMAGERWMLGFRELQPCTQLQRQNRRDHHRERHAQRLDHRNNDHRALLAIMN